MELWFSKRSSNCRCYCGNSFIIFKYWAEEMVKILINLLKNKYFDNKLLLSFLNYLYLT